MWKYLREKQFSKWFLAYLVFILLNYIICIAPIGASYYFTSQNFLLSSFFAYCFTLLAVTVYSFIYIPKEDVGGTILANLGIVITMLLMIGFIALFILYNLVTNITEALNRSIAETVGASFIPVLILTVVLSIPVIKLQVAADKPKQLIKKIKKSEDEGDLVISEISEEGIS